MQPDAYPSRVLTEPAWLQRADPVAHAPWRSDAPLTREQHEGFERHGYLVLEGLFAPDEVQALQIELYRLQNLPVELDLDTVIAEPESGAVRSIFAIHEQSPLFARLTCDARLVATAQHLLGDDVYVHQSRLNYKTGFDGKEFYWHSDFETWHVEDGMPRMRALSMSIQLADNHAVNGPLMLMPGSQNTYVACVGETPDDHYRQSLRRQEYGVPDRASLTLLAERGGITAPTGPAGSVIIFDCNTMHGSNGNITPYPRANAFIVFNAMANQLVRPYGGKPPRPDFIARRAASALRPQTGSLSQRAGVSVDLASPIS
ncbi:ectoine hydroxylase [Phenylobacterium sp.]|uniref:ectoine hydroxylase n=1 Tax=Phenylobacterium sp. TaxID=1871053 RepID=UPI00272FC68A|nr:ectoine hydroxylase [Phenylobacterium sp.]MDP1601048.1 ectoine hydroxylase [Phenylobacterium sp.]MDP3594584.1 ectoine hydroxylase [Phenylobacterium sp.]